VEEPGKRELAGLVTQLVRDALSCSICGRNFSSASFARLLSRRTPWFSLRITPRAPPSRRRPSATAVAHDGRTPRNVLPRHNTHSGSKPNTAHPVRIPLQPVAAARVIPRAGAPSRPVLRRRSS
jgi:hypothetical protein